MHKILKVDNPVCCLLKPSALVFKYSGGLGQSLVPVFKQRAKFFPVGSTPIILHCGDNFLAAKTIPDAKLE